MPALKITPSPMDLPSAATPQDVPATATLERAPIDVSLWADSEAGYNLLTYSHPLQLSNRWSLGPMVLSGTDSLKPSDGYASAGVSASLNLGGENEVLFNALLGTGSFQDAALTETITTLAFLFPWGEDGVFLVPEVDAVREQGVVALSAGAAVYVPVGPVYPFAGPYLNYDGDAWSVSAVVGINFEL